jgi:dihydrofolate synthase/folylpolyglutamate synthase
MSEASAPSGHYRRAVDRLMRLADFERARHSPAHRTFRLDRIRALLRRLGDPHLAVPTLHITGTNGKGSTSAMLSSLLQAHGLRVGLYTSPHLLRVTERIRHGLDPIEPAVFARLVDAVWDPLQQVARDTPFGEPTTVEALTAMALLHFRQAGVDAQVIEVGLGGELDSTNVVTPSVCAITNISFDHVAVLGPTIESIARAKAGIIKPEVPVVLAPQMEGALEVALGVAARQRAPVTQVGTDVRWSVDGTAGDRQRLRVETRRASYRIDLPLAGDYQGENAAVAVAAGEIFLGERLDHEAVLRGLAAVRWPGRLERMRWRGVQVIVDGAHSPYAMQRMVGALAGRVDPARTVAVVGALTGHDLMETLQPLRRLAGRAYAVRSHHPRAEGPEAVARALRKEGFTVLGIDGDVAAATGAAAAGTAAGGPPHTVVATGSLSVVAEVIACVRGVPIETYPTIRGRLPDPAERPADSPHAVRQGPR